MHFEKGYIYHIYNQGNNKERLFFSRENYLFFLQKIKTYIIPYTNIFAWCLMPNHFHLMVVVNYTELPNNTEGVNNLKSSVSPEATPVVKLNDVNDKGKKRTFNDSIGIMLRSYTNALNKQKNRSGKLFREATKAECLNCPKGITPSFIGTSAGIKINISNPEKQYPQICFNYIHQNPIKAGLVKNETDWEFSSARDYAGVRNGTLINKEIAQKYLIY
jgi:putative transposase